MPALKPEISIPAAVATGTIVVAIQGRGMPTFADVRASQTADDDVIDSVRKQNSWMAAAAVAGISLIARDPVIFIVGGTMVIAFDWMARVNILANPITNSVLGGSNTAVQSAPNVTRNGNEQVNLGGLTAVP